MPNIRLIISGLCAIALLSMAMQTASKSPFQQVVGTWEWYSGTQAFRLALQDEPGFKLPDGRTVAVLLGKHRYTRNGAIVEESFTMAGQDGNPGFTLFGVPPDEHGLWMSFRDLTKNKQGRVTLKVVPGKPNDLQWHLTVPTETVGIGKPTPIGFTVPTDMVLHRVK